MWQRFTQRARRLVFFAQEEAGRNGENYVSTEHLLLGMLRENDSVAAKILVPHPFKKITTHQFGRLAYKPNVDDGKPGLL